jgi:acetyl-CoA carboxylase biotin carboxylase subunit
LFKKILIANRGEITVRIIRACREMGISPVVVYSEADRTALHVRLADNAYSIGAAPSTESYLVIDKIIDAAQRSGAEAIHPGYGFLAENHHFAQACEAAGIKLIGPSTASMQRMGSKTEARQALRATNVPIVPGTTEPLRSEREALDVARQVGFPIMLKAAAGGGGKGMRLVHEEVELAGALRDARSEAQAAFNDSSVYVEKYISHPRHIEIQILADAFGSVVYLGERECSVQRRHQKVIEECPSPIVDAAMRQRMGEAAVQVARVAQYENAGTIEFIVDENKNFYFLEMNTRLQVEHPITEMVTGVDIVKEQIRIAAGHKLSIAQKDVKMRGAAIECRIYAEDPENNFYPFPGKILSLKEPGGPGVRCDSGVYEGYEVPIYYDPLITKLIAYGKDRTEAIERMRRALAEYKITGIKTTIPFFLDVLDDEQFLRGEYDTVFISEFLKRRSLPPVASQPEELKHIAVIAAAIMLFENGKKEELRPTGKTTESKWKDAGRIAGISNKL